MKIIRIIKHFIYKINVSILSGEKLSRYYSNQLGISIGKKTRFTGKNIKFGSEPFLISIGSNCTITSGVSFQTHDGGVALFRKDYPGMNIFGKITIGDNVFIGNNVIIMPNVTIGSNVVIGAGSIVTKDCPADVVIAGIPAKVIKTKEEYLNSSLKKAVYIRETEPSKRIKEIKEKINFTNNLKNL